MKYYTFLLVGITAISALKLGGNDRHNRLSDCPSECTCHAHSHNHKKTLTVDCSGAGMTQLPKYLPPADYYNLDFSGTNIEEIHASTGLSYFVKTRSLDMRQGILKEISLPALHMLAERVEVLNMQNNMLSGFPKEIASIKFPHLRKMNLDENPFQCDCTDTKWFLEWLASLREKNILKSSKRFSCKLQDSIIREEEVAAFCKTWEESERKHFGSIKENAEKAVSKEQLLHYRTNGNHQVYAKKPARQLAEKLLKMREDGEQNRIDENLKTMKPEVLQGVHAWLSSVAERKNQMNDMGKTVQSLLRDVEENLDKLEEVDADDITLSDPVKSTGKFKKIVTGGYGHGSSYFNSLMLPLLLILPTVIAIVIAVLYSRLRHRWWPRYGDDLQHLWDDTDEADNDAKTYRSIETKDHSVAPVKV